MPLTAGTRLGPHEISAPIGAGGMGEVYRATDTNLNRSVAIKVLPESVAGDPDRLARFQREAELLAALNHPNIAAVYGLERSGGTTALVMELVEGPTLADRIARGPLPVNEALAIAKQIAEALEAAHEQGIIHRDLKPANVKVRDDGTVKVLDFGLAKALEPAAGASSPESTHSPTLTSPAMSQGGVILGTAAYMSPEQARGKPVDRRADVWAFGAVLYEMLTGQRAFPGEDMTDTLAAVIRAEPSWEALPEELSPTIRAFLGRCLEKDPDQRVHHVADVRLALEGAFDSPPVRPPDASRSDSLEAWLRPASLVGLVCLLGGMAFGRVWLGSPGAEPTQGLTRFTVRLPPGLHLSGGVEYEERWDFARQRPSRRSFALSPDGRELVFVASDGTTPRLFRRPMDRAEALPMSGTEGAGTPVFSPDGRAVAFRAGSELKRVSIETGEVRALTLSGSPEEIYGFSWTGRDSLVFGSPEGAFEVSANGGRARRLTAEPSARGDPVAHPQLLPGGRALLFDVRDRSTSERDIFVEILDTGQRRVVVEGGTDPRYVSSGHLLFVRTGRLMAVPFDGTRLETTGTPIVVMEDVMHAENGGNSQLNTGAGQFAVSRSGALAFAPGGIYPAFRTAPMWVDRTGAAQALPLPPGSYSNGRYSPDGLRVAYTEGYGAAERHIWVYDIALGTPLRLTAAGANAHPTWSPDGTRLAFSSVVDGRRQLFWLPSDGSGEPEQLAKDDATQLPSSWSPDGTLAFLRINVQRRASDIWTVSMEEHALPQPFLETPELEAFPAFSPDGRWLAYSSDETGSTEVYVRPFPAAAPVYRVSTTGGEAPVWSPDGRQLYFRTSVSAENSAVAIMVADVSAGPVFTRSPPRKLFTIDNFAATVPIRSWDIAPDGQRFLMFERAHQEPQPVTEISVVLNWFEELNELVPVD